MVLCLNGGSATLKFAQYKDETLLVEGELDSYDIPAVFKQLKEPPEAVGHRIVHGGRAYSAPQRIDGRVLERLESLIPFAPLHLPNEIRLIRAVTEHFPDLPQVACFDTAFHQGMPDVAKRFALPRALFDEGVHRYGFHGLSYEYIVSEVKDGGRMVIAHLGNGASLAAVLNGKPMDTTMGLTPTGGIMSGTRSGDLDPGVLFYLMREKGYDVDRLERLLNRESGLLGVSGQTSDMKVLLEEGEVEATELFCYQVKKTIGAYAALLGGLDTLVFTGGIGERAAPIREKIVDGLGFLGAFEVKVMRTNEDLMIARHTEEVLF